MLRKSLAVLGIDNLNNADQITRLGFHNRRHQHLLGAVAGFGINCLEKIKLRTDRLEISILVYITNIQHTFVDGNKSGNRLLIDRQLDVLEGIQADFDFRNDRAFVFARQIDREPVGKKQPTKLR